MRIYLNPPEHFLRIKQSEDRSSGDTVLLFAPVRDLIARSNCYNPLRYPELLQDSEKSDRERLFIAAALRDAADARGNIGSTARGIADSEAFCPGQQLLMCAMECLHAEPTCIYNLEGIALFLRAYLSADPFENSAVEELSRKSAGAESLLKALRCASEADIRDAADGLLKLLMPVLDQNCLAVSMPGYRDGHIHFSDLLKTAYTVKTRNVKGEIRSYKRCDSLRDIETDENIRVEDVLRPDVSLYIRAQLTDRLPDAIVRIMIHQLLQYAYDCGSGTSAVELYLDIDWLCNPRNRSVLPGSLAELEEHGIRVIFYRETITHVGARRFRLRAELGNMFCQDIMNHAYFTAPESGSGSSGTEPPESGTGENAGDAAGGAGESDEAEQFILSGKDLSRRSGIFAGSELLKRVRRSC